MTGPRAVEAPPAELLDLMKRFERAIRANDYKELARVHQRDMLIRLEIYQAVCSVLPRDHKLVQQLAVAVLQTDRPLTQRNAALLASSLDALLVTIQFQFPSSRGGA